MPYDRYGDQPLNNNFAGAVIEDLIPWIDDTYRTLTDPKHRAVGGLSRGAGWAVHLAVYHWKFFSALGAHSLAVFATDTAKMRFQIDSIPEDSLPRVYVDVGERDHPPIIDSAMWFEDILNKKNIPHEWHFFSGYHNEEYWQSHMEQYLRWYAKEW
jgi:enterochelin esterase-like enzyme